MEMGFVDRISNLPKIILHQILSLLPRKDAGRTMVLSKQWYSVWESFPILDFDQYSVKPVPNSTQEMDNFLNSVKKRLTRFALCNLKVHQFNLSLTIEDPELSSKLYECLELALNSGAFTIVVHHWKLCVSLPETTIAPNRFKCYYSIQELYLAGLPLSEESIHGIVHNCPNLRSLHFGCLDGLRELKIKKLDRLEVVSIVSTKHLSIEMDAPNLREFHFVSFYKDRPNFADVDLTSCRGLRKLSLGKLRITDELFRSLISWFPLLEDLSIQSFEMLRRVTVSAPCLTRLVVNYCNKIEAIEIDAPALSSFRYDTEILAPLFLKNMPTHMEIVHRLWLIPVGTSRFVNLREFLSTSTIGDLLTVVVSKKVKFDLDELRQVVIPPAFQLEHLKLKFQQETLLFDEGSLIDGLLWSCHPKKISVSWNTLPQNSFIKILCERLLEMEKSPTCCGSSTVKCWRHALKSARIEGGLDEQHWTLLLPPDDAKASVICFNLEWDHKQ